MTGSNFSQSRKKNSFTDDHRPGIGETAIAVNSVSKSFKDLRAVKNVSFSVPRGTCFGLLGPNGAGKTTMMKMLYGKSPRDNPEPGQIRVFGYDPLDNELEIKQVSGIVPQDDNLDVELSVIQNLMIYARFYGIKKSDAGERIDYLLEFMELTEKSRSRIRELSGGMRRRLIIARALINNPMLLVLDEPTTGLDPQVRHLIWDKLRKLRSDGVTILLTTHYMEEAFQLCDRIMIMHLGQTIIEGAPADLVRDNIERFVLEIYDSNCGEIAVSKNYRIEKSGGRTLLYSDRIAVLERLTEKFCSGGFYLRQSNLEDVFMKATGKDLNE